MSRSGEEVLANLDDEEFLKELKHG